MTQTQVNLNKAQNGAAGTHHQGGFKLAKPVKNDNYKNYCFKCGKHMSEHKGFFKSCPK